MAALLAAALAAACGDDRTAIVLETVNEAHQAIDVVVFRVSGPGLDGGANEATAPVSGPSARPFPLTLVLLGSAGSSAGPYAVAIEGRRSGEPVAQAVRTDGETPVAFSPGKVVHFRFALRAPAPPASSPPPMTPEPPATPPPAMPPPAMCTATDTCTKDHPCACAAGCACQFTCGAGDHCVVRCEGAGTSCEIDTAGVKMTNVDCVGGAACLVRGAVEKGEVHLGCEGGTPLPCSDEIQVCNRSCP